MNTGQASPEVENMTKTKQKVSITETSVEECALCGTEGSRRTTKHNTGCVEVKFECSNPDCANFKDAPMRCPACPKCKEPIERLEVEQTHRVRGELQPDGFIENEMGRPEDIETEVYRCPACNYVISYEYEEACAFMSKEWDGVHRPVKNEVKP